MFKKSMKDITKYKISTKLTWNSIRFLPGRLWVRLPSLRLSSLGERADTSSVDNNRTGHIVSSNLTENSRDR